MSVDFKKMSKAELIKEVERMRGQVAPRFRIPINQKVIDSAVKSDSARCMISDSIRDYFKEKWGYAPTRRDTDLIQVTFTNPETNKKYVYETPPVAKKALLQFDEGCKITPFVVDLRKGGIVDLSTKKGPKRKAPKKVVGRRVTIKGNNNIVHLPPTKHGDHPERDRTHIIPSTRFPKGILRRRIFGIKAIGDLRTPTNELPSRTKESVAKFKKTMAAKRKKKK